LFSVAIDHRYRLVNSWIEYFAFTFKWCHSVRLNYIPELQMDQAQTFGNCVCSFAGMQKRAIKVVQHVEKPKQNVALARLFRQRAFLFRSPAVIIEFGQQPEMPFALVSQNFLESLDAIV
jgi:hypothetical protein